MASPLLPGVGHVTVALVSPRIALAPTGTKGGPAGTKIGEGANSPLISSRVEAVTVTKYRCPLVRPVMIALAAGSVTVVPLNAKARGGDA